jgi:hypothetical protein
MTIWLTKGVEVFGAKIEQAKIEKLIEFDAASR